MHLNVKGDTTIANTVLGNASASLLQGSGRHCNAADGSTRSVAEPRFQGKHKSSGREQPIGSSAVSGAKSSGISTMFIFSGNCCTF